MPLYVSLPSYQRAKTYVVPIQTLVTYPGQNPYLYAQPPTPVTKTCFEPSCACCQSSEFFVKEKIYQQPLAYVQPTTGFGMKEKVYQQPGYSSGAGFGAGFVYGEAVEKACCYCHSNQHHYR